MQIFRITAIQAFKASLSLDYHFKWENYNKFSELLSQSQNWNPLLKILEILRTTASLSSLIQALKESMAEKTWHELERKLPFDFQFVRSPLRLTKFYNNHQTQQPNTTKIVSPNYWSYQRHFKPKIEDQCSSAVKIRPNPKNLRNNDFQMMIVQHLRTWIPVKSHYKWRRSEKGKEEMITSAAIAAVTTGEKHEDFWAEFKYSLTKRNWIGFFCSFGVDIRSLFFVQQVLFARRLLLLVLLDFHSMEVPFELFDVTMLERVSDPCRWPQMHISYRLEWRRKRNEVFIGVFFAIIDFYIWTSILDFWHNLKKVSEINLKDYSTHPEDDTMIFLFFFWEGWYHDI